MTTISDNEVIIGFAARILLPRRFGRSAYSAVLERDIENPMSIDSAFWPDLVESEQYVEDEPWRMRSGLAYDLDRYRLWVEKCCDQNKVGMVVAVSRDSQYKGPAFDPAANALVYNAELGLKVVLNSPLLLGYDVCDYFLRSCLFVHKSSDLVGTEMIPDPEGLSNGLLGSLNAARRFCADYSECEGFDAVEPCGIYRIGYVVPFGNSTVVDMM